MITVTSPTVINRFGNKPNWSSWRSAWGTLKNSLLASRIRGRWSWVMRTSESVLSTFSPFYRWDPEWLHDLPKVVRPVGSQAGCCHSQTRVFLWYQRTDTLALYEYRFIEGTLIHYHKVSVLMLALSIVFMSLINTHFTLNSSWSQNWSFIIES